MRFTTDQQTLEDLNIFGRNGVETVFTMFNRTHTRGGAAILEEWFRYPLADAAAINQRSETIRYFIKDSAMVFPFRTELFDEVEQYLLNTDERSKLNLNEQTLVSRITNLVSEDSAYTIIYKGVTSLAEFLQQSQQFTHSFNKLNGDLYFSEKKAIDDLLTEPELYPLIQETKKVKWAFSKIAAADILLRFRYRELIRKMLRWIYQLDVYISIAKLAAEKGFATAKALDTDKQYLCVQGLYHPQIRNAVSNNIEISPANNLVFLTGANMAGKSTFMKSLGIVLFLAHAGLPVPAGSMIFSVREGMYTTINLSDDLRIGASHFYAEVLRVKKIAKELGQSKSLFIIFDELFRGTNVADAHEATVALCTAFAQCSNSIFVISTHIIEAGELLKEQISNINFVYLPTSIQNNKPVYTYRLENGITADRHGMVIIRNEGILEMLEKGIHQ